MLTVGDIRRTFEGLPDNAEVGVKWGLGFEPQDSDPAVQIQGVALVDSEPTILVTLVDLEDLTDDEDEEDPGDHDDEECETCGGTGEVPRNGRADPSRPDAGPIMDPCPDCTEE